MNLRAIITSFPLLRRAWRLLPGPLRLPVMGIGLGIYVWRRATGRDVPGDQSNGTSSGGGAGRR